MKLFSALKQAYEDFKMQKYYTSIKDCPMYNWVSVYEDNDFSHLSKTGKICKRVTNVYDKIQDELIREFGINEDFVEVLRNKIDIELHYAEQIRTKVYSNQIFIDILEIKNEELLGKKKKSDIYESIIPIEKAMGFKFDVKKITIYEFYTYNRMLANKYKHENVGK